MKKNVLFNILYQKFSYGILAGLIIEIELCLTTPNQNKEH